MREVRIQKFIADSGITSRRKAEELILQGLVQKNGQLVTELGTKVNPYEDVVHVSGQVIDAAFNEKVYLLMNKPRSVVSTVSDPEGRQTVLDFCKVINKRIYPVGRLDYLSEGLMILTNDGELTQMLLHPKYEVTKVYEVKVFGSITEGILKNLREGVESNGEFLKPKSVRVIKQLPGKTWLEFRLQEGRNREIRRLCESCGLTIDKLRRVAIGNLSIEGIKPGDFVMVTKHYILKQVGLNEKGERVRDLEYFSGKKTIPKRKRDKFTGKGSAADNEGYRLMNKANYYETIKRKKELKETTTRS